MFYKGIIFDLDDTLYDYEYTHNISIQKCFIYLNEITSINIDIINKYYKYISDSTKFDLINTASSHNKSIYIKLLLEKLNLCYPYINVLNQLYWNTFLENIIVYPYVIDFINWNKKLGIKIAILSDYETEFQILKLEKLKIINSIDYILTSEEIGVEKPSSYGYLKILYTLNLKKDEVIMIGDNYNKDIVGANHLNIKSYHFDKIDFKTFYYNLLQKFNNIYEELTKFRNISHYCGERLDLVQAGGGNISFKIEDLMFIKSSGINLSSINIDKGYSIINNDNLLIDINNNNIKCISNYSYFGDYNPSIETLMHSILKKYTIHLHPIQVNKILIRKDAKIIINKLFHNFCIIDYVTPGEKLLNLIKLNYNNEKIIFLINHGIIFTSDNIDEIYKLIEDTINIFEKYDNKNYQKYKNTNIISNIINKKFNSHTITYLCENEYINQYLKLNNYKFDIKITNPDFCVYCGDYIFYDINNINNFYKPIIIIYDHNLYINSNSINKCREIEEVLKSNIYILENNDNIMTLDTEEIKYLLNWDAEIYRKNMNN